MILSDIDICDLLFISCKEELNAILQEQLKQGETISNMSNLHQFVMQTKNSDNNVSVYLKRLTTLLKPHKKKNLSTINRKFNNCKSETFSDIILGFAFIHSNQPVINKRITNECFRYLRQNKIRLTKENIIRLLLPTSEVGYDGRYELAEHLTCISCVEFAYTLSGTLPIYSDYPIDHTLIRAERIHSLAIGKLLDEIGVKKAA
ncbi:hypothetical protein [Photobacterium leiognathi]|uniref:hypothetical protein n=1 Tax=Photobacterium leiognathi TaxID=553611 RepID=UPI0029826706|nr:hypothetical protein [Photobacterium leiognathi]